MGFKFDLHVIRMAGLFGKEVGQCIRGTVVSTDRRSHSVGLTVRSESHFPQHTLY